MQKPPLDPKVADNAPFDSVLTGSRSGSMCRLVRDGRMKATWLVLYG